MGGTTNGVPDGSADLARLITPFWLSNSHWYEASPLIAGTAAEATTPSCDRLSASLRVAEFTSRFAAATRPANDVRIGSRNAVHHAGSTGETSPFADAAGARF